MYLITGSSNLTKETPQHIFSFAVSNNPTNLPLLHLICKNSRNQKDYKLLNDEKFKFIKPQQHGYNELLNLNISDKKLTSLSSKISLLTNLKACENTLPNEILSENKPKNLPPEIDTLYKQAQTMLISIVFSQKINFKKYRKRIKEKKFDSHFSDERWLNKIADLYVLRFVSALPELMNKTHRKLLIKMISSLRFTAVNLTIKYTAEENFKNSMFKTLLSPWEDKRLSQQTMDLMERVFLKTLQYNLTIPEDFFKKD